MNSNGTRAGSPYETSDLNLAAFLRCRGFEIAAIRRVGDGRTTFSFAETDALSRAILDFANDGPIGARSFSNTLRDLKGMVRPPSGERPVQAGGRR